MSDAALDDVLEEVRSSILTNTAARISGDVDMVQVAAHRDLSEAGLSEQVLGFWLECIRSDLALGSTWAMAQNLEWLVRLRDGHALPFENAAVGRCFAHLSDEIETHLDTTGQRRTYGDYKREVEKQIRRSFPGR